MTRKHAAYGTSFMTWTEKAPIVGDSAIRKATPHVTHFGLPQRTRTLTRWAMAAASARLYRSVARLGVPMSRHDSQLTAVSTGGCQSIQSPVWTWCQTSIESRFMTPGRSAKNHANIGAHRKRTGTHPHSTRTAQWGLGSRGAGISVSVAAASAGGDSRVRVIVCGRLAVQQPASPPGG